MGKVAIDMSMSLDGYIAAQNDVPAAHIVYHVVRPSSA